MMKDFFSLVWELVQLSIKWIFSNIGFVVITLFCMGVITFMHYMGTMNFPFIVVTVLSSPIKLDSIILYAILVLLIGYLLYKINKRIKNESIARPEAIVLSIAVLILILFCYFCKQSSTEFGTFLTILLGIIAFEIMWCWIILPVIYYVRKFKKQSDLKEITSKHYLSDRAWEDTNTDDELNFSPYVGTLIGIIEEMPVKDSHSIAITGEWGSGKSTFINMAKTKLEKDRDRFIVIRFEPLESKNAENIQIDFLDLLKNTLSKYDDTFDSSFDNYKELLGLVDNKFINLLANFKNGDLKSEKEKIEKSIAKLDQRIIIIVEDVDRLTKEELLQVFRLVGYNARFPRTVYLLAMDKHKVEKTLSRDEGATEVSDTHFSEKYYEMEFPIPETTSGQIVSYVKKHISTKIDFDLIHAEDISYCIPTLRDAKRFLNYFNYRVPLLKGLDELSFFILSLIRYRNESIYQDIKTRELIRYNENQKKYIVKEWITDDKSKNGEIGEFAISSSRDIITGRQLKEKFPYRYIDKSLFSLLKMLFADDAHRKNLISSPNCFFYYFVESAGGLLEYGEMELLLTLPMGELISRIDKYNEDDCIKEFLKLYWEQFDPDVLENDKTTLGHYYIIRDYLKIEELTYLGENIGCARGMEKPVASDIMLDDTIPSPTYHNRLVGLDDGNMVNDERYQSVYKFQGNHAIAQKNYKYGVINIKGKLIIPFDYDQIRSHPEKILALKKDDKWYSVEYNADMTLSVNSDGYDDIFYYPDCSSIVAVRDNKGILLKHSGKEFKFPQDMGIYALSEAQYAVYNGAQWGIFDVDKMESPDNIEYKYNEIRRLRTSFATKRGSEWCIIDFHGNKIFESDRIAEIEEVSDNMFSIESLNAKKALYKGSDRLTDFKYHEIRSCCEGEYFSLKDNSGVSLVDQDGILVLEDVYDKIKIYQEGWAIVKKDREWYYVKFSDKILNRITIDKIFDDMNDFHEGYAAVCLDSQKWGYVNTDFQLVVPCIYHYASDVKDGKAEVRLYSIEKEIDLKEIENSKKL